MAGTESTPRAGGRQRARRKSRLVPIFVTLTIGGGLIWWGWTKTHASADTNPRLITATVVRGDIHETVSATGSVTAQTGAQVKIGSQITGRIKRLYADVGSKVRAGQIIAELDLPDIDAQLEQAKASLASARTRLQQQETGVGMQQTQTRSAVAQADAELHSAQARLKAIEASAQLQSVQTPTEIQRAGTTLKASQAALATAQANLTQVQAGANLQIGNASEQLKQSQATARNAELNLNRQRELLKKGFVAASVVDAAEATSAVNLSQVTAARQNLQLVKEKVTAEVKTAQNQVTQAQQTVEANRAALQAAKAGTYQEAARQADVQSARAQVDLVRASLTTARGNLTQNAIKQQDILQAREAVRVAEAQVNFYRAQLDKTFIRSPISGTVLQLASQQGETLAAGLSAPTLIIVADLNRLQVDVYVDETDIGKVRLGQEASVTVDAFPRQSFKGSVTKIASGSTIQQGVVTYDVSIAIRDPKHILKPDMSANVTLNVGKRENVLIVPTEAVKIGVRKTTVNLAVIKNGKQEVESRPVKTGTSDGASTEIKEGLGEGETVVLAGMEDPSKRQRPASPFGPSGGGGRKR